MDLALAEATVQPLVAMVLKDGVIPCVDNTCVVGGVDQSLVVLGNLSSEQKSLLIIAELHKSFLVFELLASRLYGEVGLTCCDHGFCGIAVLDDQVAGVARERDVFDPSLPSLPEFDHFNSVVKMIINIDI